MLGRLDKTISTRTRKITDKKRIKRVILLDLLHEYLTNKGYRIECIDSYSNKEWISSCTQKKDTISCQFPINFQIIDKMMGVNKESFAYLKQADILLVPFIPNLIIIPWFNSLTKLQQKKVYFLANHQPKNEQKQTKPKKTNLKTDSRITFALNVNIIQKAEKFLQGKWKQDDYTHASLSALIRASLQAYQQGKINLVKSLSNKNTPKKNFNMRIDENLLNFYNSLPNGQRVKFIERALLTYLNRI